MSRVYAANKGASVIKTVIAVIASAVMLYPLLWMLASSFKPQHLIFQDLSLWPDVFTLENYINGWNGFTNLTFGTFFKNSFIVVLFCIIGNLLTCSMAAYAAQYSVQHSRARSRFESAPQTG